MTTGKRQGTVITAISERNVMLRQMQAAALVRAHPQHLPAMTSPPLAASRITTMAAGPPQALYYYITIRQ
jgi:hypothetical protein